MKYYYYRYTRHNHTSLWAKRDDGMEKCIAQNTIDYWTDAYAEWHNIRDLTFHLFRNTNTGGTTEITEEEVFLEQL